jgi:hypothetical protein
MFTHNKPRDSAVCVRALIAKTHIFMLFLRRFSSMFLLMNDRPINSQQVGGDKNFNISNTFFVRFVARESLSY